MKKIITAIAISFVMLLNSAIAESGHTGHCDSFKDVARVVKLSGVAESVVRVILQ